jgi:predicted lipoprotein with Yx(FWY)xxD motif
MLVDSEGRSLYLLTEDERNASSCTGDCADAWVPLLTEVDPIAGEGVDASRLGTISRDDGALQVTYNGRALYYFAGDSTMVGDVNGQDTGGVWFIVSPDGSAIQTAAVVNVVEHNDLGAMLTDAAGRSLYLSARDQRQVSNCTGVCARVWPPLLTVDDPVAGDGVSVEPLGTITRRDGSRQVTYAGHLRWKTTAPIHA